jgi:hypothetical protein
MRENVIFGGGDLKYGFRAYIYADPYKKQYSRLIGIR